MINKIGNILSGAQSKQLTAIKNVQRDIDTTQLKLASGKDVNKALDNPSNFFNAKSLTSSASDLNRLLDTIGQSTRTIQETDIAIRAVQKLIDQAEALLIEAEIELFPSGGEPEPTIIPDSIADFIPYAGAQDGGGTVSLANGGLDITFSGNNWKRLDFGYTITENTILRFDYQSTILPEISAIGFDNDNNFSNNPNFFFLNGTQNGGISYAAPQPTFEYDRSGDVVSIEIPVGQFFTGDFNFITFINDHDAAPANGNATFTNVTFFEGNDVLLPRDKQERAAQYEAQYNEILNQLDALVEDASYRGINLLDSDDLRTDFNAPRTNFLETEGIDGTSLGLGLTDRSFQSLNRLRTSLGQVREARETLREYNATIASDLNIIQTRLDFTQKSINTLKNGSEDLTLTDLNEAGAEMISLQTRQSIQISILSQQDTSIADLLQSLI
ncbi:MAG: hypothetical protein GW903_08230 [Alphaproteobacteria bacterium]|nr:hypothetical protein [Alphaproteobacteria bacterium]NCQ88801.1 hypothetical protein [Alphaproteobacteria bacterium]NCT07276.1 hypothetical protein [Alphaproteobacteria bacterium]